MTLTRMTSDHLILKIDPIIHRNILLQYFKYRIKPGEMDSWVWFALASHVDLSHPDSIRAHYSWKQ